MDNVNVVALVDLPEQTDPGYPTRRCRASRRSPRPSCVELDDGRWNEVADYGEVSMGRPDALATFIEEAADRSRPTSTAWSSPTTAVPGPAATSTPARRRPRS